LPRDVKADTLWLGSENRFIRYVKELKGRNVELGLISGTIINGQLIDVFFDHLLIEAHRGQYRVRLLAIEYIRV